MPTMAMKSCDVIQLGAAASLHRISIRSLPASGWGELGEGASSRVEAQGQPFCDEHHQPPRNKLFNQCRSQF